jgi:hypothetical protein
MHRSTPGVSLVPAASSTRQLFMSTCLLGFQMMQWHTHLLNQRCDLILNNGCMASSIPALKVMVALLFYSSALVEKRIFHRLTISVVAVFLLMQLDNEYLLLTV